jgi:protein-L-isoaspartate(D-aspartate) O-methyltransferase
MSRLVNNLIRNGYLKNDLIIEAFAEINRIEFLPKELEAQADADVALPIGFGQTISQPMTVAFMLELLDPQRGQNILDVGSGSGWTSALLAYVVGSQGKIIAVERFPELMEFGKKNADKFGYVKKGIAEFYDGDGSKGFLEKAPFDRILVSAEAETVPEELKKQLKIGGKMVIPMKNSIWYLEKKSEEDFEKEEYPGFAFVPLIIM